jgi:serine O-acetyltransferase
MTYDPDTVKEWAGNSQWRAFQADYRRFRQVHGFSGWRSEGLWVVAIYRMQRALGKSRTPWLWAPASKALAVARNLLRTLTHIELHPGAEIGAGLMILHGSQIRVARGVKIGVGCVLGHVCTIGNGPTPGVARIGDHVHISPHSCILGPVTIGDGAMIAASSLVLSDVPAGHTAIGVPARILPGFKGQQADRDDIRRRVNKVRDLTSLSATILNEIRTVAAEQGKACATLTDDLALDDSGLDSLCIAILIARLEDITGRDPIGSDEKGRFPRTIGELIALYEQALV